MHAELRVTPEQVIMKLELMKAGRNQGQMGWWDCHRRRSLKPDMVSQDERKQLLKAHIRKVLGNIRILLSTLRRAIPVSPCDSILKADDARRQIVWLRGRQIMFWASVSSRVSGDNNTYLLLAGNIERDSVCRMANTGAHAWCQLHDNIILILYKWLGHCHKKCQ